MPRRRGDSLWLRLVRGHEDGASDPKPFAALLSLTGILLVTGAGVAQADRPTVINEDNTSFACEYFPEGQPQINVSINYDAVSGGGHLLHRRPLTRRRAGPRQRLHARRHRKRRVVWPGTRRSTNTAPTPARWSWRAPTRPPASPSPCVTASGRPERPDHRHPRLHRAGGDLVHLPGRRLRRLRQVTCFGQRSQTSNRVLQPHRLVRAGPDLFGPPIAAKQCPQRTRRLMCRDVVD